MSDAASSPGQSSTAGGAPPPAAEPLKPRIDAAPILSLQEETCPKCGAAMQPTDVVCLKCGYDLKANTVRQVETGTTPAPDEEPSDEPFVAEGDGGAQLWGIIGGIITIGAMIIVGITMPAGAAWYVTLGAIVLVLYNVAVHTATGFGAVAIAARICEQKLGSFEQAAARIFAAFALFEMVRHLHIAPLGRFSTTAAHLLAGGAYFLAVWGLFRKTRAITLLIVLSHFVLWIIFELGMQLSGWVFAARAAAVATGQGGG